MGMKIDRERKSPEQSRADQIRQIIQGSQSRIKEETRSEKRMRRPTKVPRKPQEA